MNIKKIVHKLISIHLESIRAWQPNKFVAYDLVTADWTDADFDRARTAQEVADGFLTTLRGRQ